MKKILAAAVSLVVFCSPALAGKKNNNNQFENWQHNREYTETYNYNYNYKYKNNNNNDAAFYYLPRHDIGGWNISGRSRSW